LRIEIAVGQRRPRRSRGLDRRACYQLCKDLSGDPPKQPLSERSPRRGSNRQNPLSKIRGRRLARLQREDCLFLGRRDEKAIRARAGCRRGEIIAATLTSQKAARGNVKRFIIHTTEKST